MDRPAVLTDLFERTFAEVHRITEEEERSTRTSTYAFSLGSLSALVYPCTTLVEAVERIARARDECGSQEGPARAANFMLRSAREVAGEQEWAKVAAALPFEVAPIPD